MSNGSGHTSVRLYKHDHRFFVGDLIYSDGDNIPKVIMSWDEHQVFVRDCGQTKIYTLLPEKLGAELKTK